jgi:hypothetical protein
MDVAGERFRKVTVLQSIFDLPPEFLEAAHLEGEALKNDDDESAAREV